MVQLAEVARKVFVEDQRSLLVIEIPATRGSFLLPLRLIIGFFCSPRGAVVQSPSPETSGFGTGGKAHH